MRVLLVGAVAILAGCTRGPVHVVASRSTLLVTNFGSSQLEAVRFAQS
jgi:hypothetical protein